MIDIPKGSTASSPSGSKVVLGGGVVNEEVKLLDDTFLDLARTFDDNISDVESVGFDNFIQFNVNGVKKYKVIDAKTSVINDMARMDNLTSTCTQNQQPIYKMIDGDATAGAITKVEMRGQQAQNAFGAGEFNPVTGKSQIQLETGVEFWVNNSTTDFTQYLIRPRIK